MKIERLEVPGLAQYSYVISDEGKAAVIDAERNIDRYLAYATEHRLTITHVLETHIHADFAAGSKALAERTGAELALSAYDEGERYQYKMTHRALRDGDTISIGEVQLRTLHTPGHTPEHLSFLLFDIKRSTTTANALFSGDFLFVGSVGRPDLLGEDAKQALAHQMFHSLHTRIQSIPDGIRVYPGHGAGSLCGSGLSQQSDSTVGFERATNPLWKLGESDFVAAILSTLPPLPKYYPRMKELNAEGSVSLIPIPGGEALSPNQVDELAKQEDVVILDLRRPEAFGGAHIPNAINMGAGLNLSLWAAWLLDGNQRIILVNDGGDDVESRRALVRVGLDRIEGYLDGGFPAWIDAGLEFSRTLQVSIQEVAARPDEVLLLDVRSDDEWRTGHIQGAKHEMLGDLPHVMERLDRRRPVITVCGSGYRSSIAASLLERKGWSDVKSMDGGMGAWTRRALPMVRE